MGVRRAGKPPPCVLSPVAAAWHAPPVARRPRLTGVALALALVASPCAPPVPEAGVAPWAPGERLRFEVGGFLSAGTLELSVERPMAGGRLLPLRARYLATRPGGPGAVRAAVAWSWVDAATLVPRRYREEVATADRRRTVDARPGAEGEHLVEVGAEGRSERRAYARAGPVLDPLSLLYQLRSARLAPGDRLCFELVADGAFWAVLAVVGQGVERVDSPLGPVDALRIDLALRRADRPEQRREARVLLGTGPGRPILEVAAAVAPARVRARWVERRASAP